MRKTLRNIVTGTAIAGSLLLFGCLGDKAKKTVDNIVKGTTEQVTRQDDAYDKARKIAENPSSIVTGEATREIPSTQLTPQTDKALVEKDLSLKDYFFQGKELEEISFLDKNGYEKLGLKNNPSVLSPREIIDFEEENFRLFLDGVQGIGFAAYSFPNSEVSIEQMVLEFENEIDNWRFLKGAEKGDEPWHHNHTIRFVNKNKSSLMTINGNIKIDEERILVDSLINYLGRVGGEFYGSGGSFSEYEEMYYGVDIPVSESGKYFKEALEFQKKFYETKDEQQIKDIFYKKLGFQSVKDKLKKYSNGEIERVELEQELQRYGKKAWTKMFLTFPNLREILDSKVISSVPILAMDYYYHQKDLGNFTIDVLLKSQNL